jgi:hypothetical protein
MGNKGAFIRFEAPDLKPNIITFAAVVSIFPILKPAMLYHLLSLSKMTKEKNQCCKKSAIPAPYRIAVVDFFTSAIMNNT